MRSNTKISLTEIVYFILIAIPITALFSYLYFEQKRKDVRDNIAETKCRPYSILAQVESKKTGDWFIICSAPENDIKVYRIVQ